jgi:hypothetical protein
MGRKPTSKPTTKSIEPTPPPTTDPHHEARQTCAECGLPMEPDEQDLDLMTQAALQATAIHMNAKRDGGKSGAINLMIYRAALTLTQERRKWEAKTQGTGGPH